MHKVDPKLSPGADAPLNVPRWIKDSRDKHRAAIHTRTSTKVEKEEPIVKAEKPERATAVKTAARPSGRRSSGLPASSSLSADSLQQHQRKTSEQPLTQPKEEVDFGSAPHSEHEELDFHSDTEMAKPVEGSTLGSWDDMESVSMISGRSGKSGRTRRIGTITVNEDDL